MTERIYDIFILVICGILIFWPMVCANLAGNIYWRMSKFTALRKTEESKKYFFAKKTIWFRALGFTLLLLFVLHLVERIKTP